MPACTRHQAIYLDGNQVFKYQSRCIATISARQAGFIMFERLLFACFCKFCIYTNTKSQDLRRVPAASAPTGFKQAV
jgi:hypothetical protein